MYKVLTLESQVYLDRSDRSERNEKQKKEKGQTASSVDNLHQF